MNNKALNHNASDQLNQPLTALAKTKTFVWSKARPSREVRQGCHNKETHHNSSNLNNFGIRNYTKAVVQNKNKRLRCIKVGNGL